MFFDFNSVTHILNIGTAPGGPVGSLSEARAHWVTADTIAWNSGGAGDVFALSYDADGNLALDSTGVVGGSMIPLSYDPAGLPASVLARFPHLAGFAALKPAAADLASVPAILRGQIAVSAVDSKGNPIDATGLQIPGVLAIGTPTRANSA